MARPRKFSEKLVPTSVTVLPSALAAVKSVAEAAGVSESEVWREALEAGLPLVPRRLKKRRDQEAKKARKAPSNVLPFLAESPKAVRKPTSGIEPLTYGLRTGRLAAPVPINPSSAPPRPSRDSAQRRENLERQAG